MKWKLTRSLDAIIDGFTTSASRQTICNLSVFAKTYAQSKRMHFDDDGYCKYVLFVFWNQGFLRKFPWFFDIRKTQFEGFLFQKVPIKG